MNETVEKLQKFANEHKVVLETRGEVGFGRPCVGFQHGNSYVAYNPLNMTTFNPLLGFEDERIGDAAPSDAYHKHACLAVLVRNDDYDEGLRQLAEWVDAMNEIGVEVVDYKTGAQGIQAMLSGITGKAVRPKEQSK